MVKCSRCGKKIIPRTRYVIGSRGGKYHVGCSGGIKDKSYGWTK